MDINELYDESYAKALAATQNQPTYTGNSYNDLKQALAQNQALANANLKKRMADIGQGQSLTVENNRQMANQNNLGNVALQQQAFTDYQNALNQQTQANAAAQASQIYADNYANKTNALLNDENNKFSTYYNLYLKKKITAKQFKSLTGVDVNTISSGSSSSSSSNIDDELGYTNPYNNGVSTPKIDTSLNTNDSILTRAYKILLDQSSSKAPYKK